ncbi:hypothetical protein HY045_00095 [Candidatus Woesebacteria bacterium]|nr:hypothetical protein [Candidatus Woesebacteria bacterium]
MPNNRERQSGQAVLIFLLFMAVVLTVALSFISRSTTDVNISSRGEQSLRAFSAAEAGVENALITGVSETGTQISSSDPSTTYTTTASAIADKDFNSPNDFYSGESMTLWFVDHDSNGNYACTGTGINCFKGAAAPSLKLCWGTPGTTLANSSALEVSVFYATDPTKVVKISGGNTTYDFSSVKVARAAIDPNGASRAGPTGFPLTNFSYNLDAGTCKVKGTAYQFQKTFNIGTDLGIPSAVHTQDYGLLFARVRFLYNTTTKQPLGGHVEPVNLPKQGLDITAVGNSGESTRKLHVFQSLGEPPGIFDSTLFSPGGLVHQ